MPMVEFFETANVYPCLIERAGKYMYLNVSSNFKAMMTCYNAESL